MEREVIVLTVLDTTDMSVEARAFCPETGEELWVDTWDIVWDGSPESLLEEFRVKAKLAERLREKGGQAWKRLAREALEALDAAAELGALTDEELFLDPLAQRIWILLEEGSRSHGPGLRSPGSSGGGGVGMEQC